MAFLNRPNIPVNHIETISRAVVDISGRDRPHPSINDYYSASSDESNRKMTFQHGLSNFSNVVFGDDRFSVKTSFETEAYSTKQQEINEIPSRTIEQTRRLYQEAQEVVGEGMIKAMEVQMREKLSQKTGSGHHVLRKTFKFFDRDGSGDIDEDEFKGAMKLMGLQFSDVQILALFSSYDLECHGAVNYQVFVKSIMEQDFKVTYNKHGGKEKNSMFDAVLSSVNKKRLTVDDSEEEDDEARGYHLQEVRKLFDLIDKDRSGFIDDTELEILFLALGKEVNESIIRGMIRKRDRNNDGKLDFDEFIDMYNQLI